MAAPDALACGPWVDIVLRRARDAGAVGTSREDVRRLIAAAQRLVVSEGALVIDQATFVTVPRQLIYPVSLLTSDADSVADRVLRIERIRSSERHLWRSTWRGIAAADRRWLRRVGAEPRTWAPFGRDFFITYPATAEPQTLVTRFVRTTDDLPTDDDVFTIREDRLPMVADIVEALLLLRGRQYEALGAVLRRLGIGQGGGTGRGAEAGNGPAAA